MVAVLIVMLVENVGNIIDSYYDRGSGKGNSSGSDRYSGGGSGKGNSSGSDRYSGGGSGKCSGNSNGSGVTCIL